MPLTSSGRSVRERSHGRSSHVSGLPKIWIQCNTAACGSSSGGRCRLARKTGSLSVVGQTQAPQKWKVRGAEVARAPTREPGVQGDDDALEAGRLGAGDEARGQVAVLWCVQLEKPWRIAEFGGHLLHRVGGGRRAIIGTPVRAEACAVARSPWPSWAHRPMTPTGAMRIGEGSVIPKRSTDRSRSLAPTNIRGIRPQPSKAVTLTRCVRSSPAPPAT